MIKLKRNIYYLPFKTEQELREKIIHFIINGNTHLIMYKGIPNKIDFKMMKKILLPPNTTIKPIEVRLKYKKIIKKDNFCLIYKLNTT